MVISLEGNQGIVAMLEPTLLVTYTLACLIFSLVPGPSVTVVVANALSGGARAGFWTILGTQISMLSMIIVVAIGLQAVMQFVGEAFVFIKLIGAAYLVWIGYKMFTNKSGLNVSNTQPVKPAQRNVIEGLLVGWSNPKTFLFLGAFLPQFVRHDQPAFAQIMALGMVLMTVTTLCDGLYAVLAGSARSALSAGRMKILNRAAGATLMIGGVWLALVKRS